MIIVEKQPQMSDKWIGSKAEYLGVIYFTNEETKAQRNDISIIKYSDDVIRTNISLSVKATEINVFEELAAEGFLSELMKNRNAWVVTAAPLMRSCCVRCPIYKIRKSVTMAGWMLSHIFIYKGHSDNLSCGSLPKQYWYPDELLVGRNMKGGFPQTLSDMLGKNLA